MKTKFNKITNIPLLSLFCFLLTFLVFYILYILLKKWEKRQFIKKKNSKDENKKLNSDIFSRIMIQRNVIPFTIGVLLSLRLRTFINNIVNTFINPLFSIDYDKDGIPDMSEISKIFNITIFGLNYNFGFLFLEFIKIVMFMIITYFLIIILYANTNYLNINFN